MAWYNYDKINSYNAMLNIILTNRGFGKSYGAKKIAIRNFLKKGEQFVYVRRYKTEITKQFKQFFDDIALDYPEHSFKIQGNRAYIDDKIAGYSMPLSTSSNDKSTPFPLVTTIIFDEFIIDTSTGIKHYIGNEVELFLDLIETIGRKRNNVKVYMLANFISEVNPYFIYFNCFPKKGERFTIARNGEMIIDVTTNDDFINEKKQTRFGQLIANTKYSDYSIDNQALRDNNTFINRFPLKQCTPCCILSYDNNNIMVHLHKSGVMYFHKKIDWTITNFSLDIDSHNQSSYLNGSVLNYPVFKHIIKCFQLGQVAFHNQEVKSICYDIFRKLGVK